MGKRDAYFWFGFVLGLLIASAVIAIHRPHDWVLAVVIAINMSTSFGCLVVYIAQRKGKVKPIDHSPLTLFPP